jgi:hypothetical protein
MIKSRIPYISILADAVRRVSSIINTVYVIGTINCTNVKTNIPYISIITDAFSNV